MSVDALYQDKILTLAKAAKSRSRLETPDHSARVDNPLCGDRVTVDLAMNDGAHISEYGHKVQGCSLCEAASEVIGALVDEEGSGMTGAEIAEVKDGLARYLSGHADRPPWTSLSVFEPVRDFKSRHKCVLLPFEAVEKALKD